MSESKNTMLLDDIPESVIKPRPRFSIFWIIPLVALIIGAWLGYRAWSEMGEMITITFKTADGLEAGKTKIKYKNVEIGIVKAIRLNHETKDVEVLAELSTEVSNYLTDKTRFWVVKARVAASGITGLETLFSGAYIGLDPISEGEETRQFVGLSSPPVVTSDDPGKHFILHTESLGSIERDMPVFYRKFNVGQVENVRLTSGGQAVIVEIFVRAPFDQWVSNKTKFWNVSGLDFSVNTSGISVDTDSVASLLIGGIAFESERLSESNLPALDQAEYFLYKNYAATHVQDFSSAERFVLNFSESVRGLAIGAPVEFRGIQIGEVLGIELFYNPEHKAVQTAVTVRFDLTLLSVKDQSKDDKLSKKDRRQHIDYLVAQGARAQLKSANLLTGQLYIDIDFFKKPQPSIIDWSSKVPQYPTMDSELTSLTRDLKGLLKKADSTMTEVELLGHNLNQVMVPELSKTLGATQAALDEIKTNLNNNSPLQQNLQETLLEVKKSARSLKRLTDFLERHPEALISGKQEQDE